MLHISLSPSRVGSVTYFLPVLLLDDEDDGGDALGVNDVEG